MSQKVNVNQKGSGKTAIIVVCALVAGLLLGGVGMMIYKDLNHGSSTDKPDTKQEDERADKLADGEVYDFEKAGYIKLGKYKGLKADVQPEDDDVYGEMIALAEEAKVKDDTVADGDVVNIDFTGKLDGVKLEEASGEDVYVWIGKEEYVNDFEKGMIGMTVGKKQTIDCKFPSDYDDEDLAGKTVQFTIKIKGKFGNTAADQCSDGQYKTVQEYFDYIKARQLDENRANKGELVWDEVRDNATVDTVPEQMLARATEEVTKMYTDFAQISGMEVDELLANFDMDENGLSEIANETVIDIMIAKTIAQKEGITMDDTYYRQALMENLGIEETDDTAGTLEELETEYKQGTGSRPRDDMLVERVKDFVGENATDNG